MVSFFGEVVFPSSRAFWDDDEEDGVIENSAQPNFSVEWLKEGPPRMKVLLVVEGDILLDVTRQCLCPNSEEVCIIKDENQKKVSVIYHVNEDVYLCLISPHFDIKYSGIFIAAIADIITSAELTIPITCNHVSKFKGEHPPSTPFLRMLQSKNAEKHCILKEQLLEQPNIVYGVAAGVLSYAEFMKKPSVLYILYIDSFALDSVSAEPLLNLYTAMNCTPHKVSFAGKDFFNKGNLYM